MSCRAYFSKVSSNRTWEPLLVAALMLQPQRAAHRAGGGTIGGFMLRRGQTTTFQERLDITERAAAGRCDPEMATALGCERLDGAQMAPPWATSGAPRPQLAHGPAHHGTTEHDGDGHARGHRADASDTSRLGADSSPCGTAR